MERKPKQWAALRSNHEGDTAEVLELVEASLDGFADLVDGEIVSIAYSRLGVRVMIGSHTAYPANRGINYLISIRGILSTTRPSDHP